VKNWGEEKMNWSGGWGDSPMDIKLIIILIYYVGEVSKIRR
jgi:hypothetical protein